MLPIKPICESKKIRKDGTSLIFLQYCYSSEKRTNLNTEIAIPPQFWNKKRLCIQDSLPAEYGSVEYLNGEIRRMHRLAEDLIDFANKKDIKEKWIFVKSTFTPDFDNKRLEQQDQAAKIVTSFSQPKINTDFFHQMEDYIQSKQKKVSKGMLRVYNHVQERLKAFETFRKVPITFENIDYNFYEGLIEFLTYDYVHLRRKQPLLGLKLNTIGLTIKQFRIFIKDRVRRKIITPIDLTDFKIPEEETDAIYLTNEEIGTIYNTDLSGSPHLVEYRDLFVLACLTGLRFSDFSILKPEDVRKGMLYKKQEKSEHWVVIPLRTEAKEIFRKQFFQSIPHLTNAEFNRHIKTIGKLAGLNSVMKFSYKKGNKTISLAKPRSEWITTHTARRSFCTNEFLAGTPVKLIMKISGHKTEKDFYRYIRITPEEAAQKIQELWMERSNGMSAFGAELKSVS
jgi:integrase